MSNNYIPMDTQMEEILMHIVDILKDMRNFIKSEGKAKSKLIALNIMLYELIRNIEEGLNV